MKFPQLPLGQRFEYQGETLVKIGVLTACNERGGNTRLIPRSAVVIPLAEQGGVQPKAAPPASLAPEQVQGALDRFEATWRAMVSELDGPHRERVEETLTSALAELRHALGLASGGHAPQRARAGAQSGLAGAGRQRQ